MPKGEHFRKYPILDEQQFTHNISKESAYVLGFLWADGHLIESSVNISSTEPDNLELERIIFRLGAWRKYVSKMKNEAWANKVVYSSNNKELNLYLNNLGYGKGRPHSACRALEGIPLKLKHYWFLGLVDGDGCFYYNDKHKLRQFQITSHIDQDWLFVEDLFKDLSIMYSIDRRKAAAGTKRRSNIRIFGRQNIKKFGEYIYSNYPEDGIGFKRKYEKWLEIIK